MSTKASEAVESYPTPKEVPTQIFVRFADTPDENGVVKAFIGCDGEDRASPKIRSIMSLMVASLAGVFDALNNAAPGCYSDAVKESLRLAEILSNPEDADRKY